MARRERLDWPVKLCPRSSQHGHGQDSRDKDECSAHLDVERRRSSQAFASIFRKPLDIVAPFPGICFFGIVRPRFLRLGQAGSRLASLVARTIQAGLYTEIPVRNTLLGR